MRNTPHKACINLIDICEGNNNGGSLNLDVTAPGEIKPTGKNALFASCRKYIEEARHHYDTWRATICISMAKTRAEIVKLKAQGPVRNKRLTSNYSKRRIEECRLMQLALLLQLLHVYWYGDMGSTAARELKESVLFERCRYAFHKAELTRKEHQAKV